MRILAIIERNQAIGHDELVYQLRRVGAADDARHVPQLIEDGLLSRDDRGIMRVTEAGKRLLSPTVARARAAALTGTDGAQRSPERPEPGPTAPAAGADLDVGDLPAVLELIIGAVPVAPDVPPRRMREAVPGQAGGIPYTLSELVDRVHLWKRLTGAPPSRADWNPEQVRRHGVQALRHVMRWATAGALYQAGDFPNVGTLRKTGILKGKGMAGLLQHAGYLPRGSGTTALDHPSARPSYAAGDVNAHQRGGLISATNRAITAVIEARKTPANSERLRDALYRLRDAAEREANTL